MEGTPGSGSTVTRNEPSWQGYWPKQGGGGASLLIVDEPIVVKGKGFLESISES